MRATRPNADLLVAVADPVRRVLIDTLLDRGDASISTLTTTVPVTRQAVTKHLAVLDRVGIVEPRRSGREVHYTLRIERVDAAAQQLYDMAAAWDRRLHRIKNIAETIHKSRRAR